jgi:hypothetical protein
MVFLQKSAPNGAFFVASGQVDVMIDLRGTERRRAAMIFAERLRATNKMPAELET